MLNVEKEFLGRNSKNTKSVSMMLRCARNLLV